MSTWTRTLVGMGAAVALVAGAAGAAPAGVADDRFAAMNGPMAGFAVKPADFGLDASRTLVDVPPLLAAIDGDREFAFVEDLAFPRTAAGPESARQDARDLVTGALTDAGYDPQLQPVVLPSTGIDSPNIWAELPGTECPGKTIVIGGHYDSAHPTGPGADDNATGTAGLVEIARALRDHPLPVTVRFASWSYEEMGLVGASVMAKQLKADGRDIVGAISLEMIGYTTPTIDPLTGLPGTYLAMISDPTSARLARAFGAAAYTYTPEFAAFGVVIDPAVLPDILRSDHAAFLAQGYPALMATDTANFRNPHYHQATDAPATLDRQFLADSTRASLAGLVTYASSDQDGDGKADVCTAPATEPSTTTTVPATTVPAPTPTDPGATAPGARPVRATPRYTG